MRPGRSRPPNGARQAEAAAIGNAEGSVGASDVVPDLGDGTGMPVVATPVTGEGRRGRRSGGGVARGAAGEAMKREHAPVATRPRPRAEHQGYAPYPAGTIPALADLLDELARQEIRYCHWKSNEHLAAGLAGLTDLDLLVDVGDAERLRAVLRGKGLRQLTPPPTKDFPGMQHFLGLDHDSGRLYHLHMHGQLVLGEEDVKNHRLPLERWFLESARPLDGVPVPPPALELAVLAVRALLKYRDRDVVKDVFGIRSPGLRDAIRAELDWLLDRATVDEVRARLREVGVVPSEVVVRFLETYQREPRAGTTFFLLRSRLRSSLRGVRRHGWTSTRARRLAARWRRRGSPARMAPAGGGRTIALVGADGSGKSTVSRELARWLGWKLDVRVHYLGSKNPSRRSHWSYLAFRALRRSHRAARGKFGPASATAGALATARDAALGLHHLAVGNDRARLLRVGRRDARAGRVVIFDRFPLAALSSRPEHLLLDGPRIRRALGEPLGRLTRWLASREEALYLTFGLPDHLVVLHVSADVAAGRKPDHPPGVLAAKARAADELAELAEGSDAGIGPIHVDADRPLDAVLLDLKRSIWDVL